MEKLDWSIDQYCKKCDEQMRPQTKKSSNLVAHEKHGLCRRCANRKGPKTSYDSLGQVCFKCKVYKTYENFTRNSECLSGYNTTCKQCKVLWIHGITRETFDQILSEQDGLCAICKRSFKEFPGSWHIDHDHACCGVKGKKACGTCIRGILCSGCNTGIGMLQDSLEVLKSAYEYLNKWPKQGDKNNDK